MAGRRIKKSDILLLEGKKKRECFEQDLEFYGFLAFENPLKPDTNEVIKEL